MTFAPGLDFLEDWLQSLIDLADQAGDMIKGTDRSHCSIALVSMLTGFHVQWFPERKSRCG